MRGRPNGERARPALTESCRVHRIVCAKRVRVCGCPTFSALMELTPQTRMSGATSRHKRTHWSMQLKKSTSHVVRSLLGIAASGLFMACADTSVGPKPAGNGASTDLSLVDGQAAASTRLPDLGSCSTQLPLPEGTQVSFHAFGIGVQIYRWDGQSWIFSNPQANLYADAGANGLVGTHFSEPFAKPNWLTNSGSRVIGTVLDKCTPNANAIPWVTLAADNSGTGVFNQTTLIQRLNTVGGIAPTTPGTVVGQLAKIPYTADYFFYRVQ